MVGVSPLLQLSAEADLHQRLSRDDVHLLHRAQENVTVVYQLT